MEYSREEMLKALQASILYLLPQAKDLDSVPEHDLDALISAPIVRFLFDDPDKVAHMLLNPSPLHLQYLR